MKFAMFRFLRNADSGAGGGAPAASAPSAPPAASGGTPGGGAAPYGDGGGSPEGSVGAPAPSGDSSGQGAQVQGDSAPAKIYLPSRFDPTWETEFNKLSPDDQQAYFQNDDRFVEGLDLPPEDQKSAEPPAPAASEIKADDPISPEILESLPPNVKALVDQALEMEERIAPFEQFLNPQFQDDLRVIMEDPRVMSIVNDMKNGQDSADSWFDKSMNMDEMMSDLEKQFQISKKDPALDPDDFKDAFGKCMKHVAEKVAKNVMLHGEIKARDAKESARRDGLKNAVYFDLAQSVESLKSKEPINSDKHPIHGFRQEIESALSGGEISWSYFEKNGKALFAAYAAKNGMVQTPEKQYAKIRDRIVKRMDTESRQAAVTSTSMRPGSQGAAPNVRHGVDASKYFSFSDSERTSIINSAIEAKNRGDDTMLRDLQTLESTGKWPG